MVVWLGGCWPEVQLAADLRAYAELSLSPGKAAAAASWRPVGCAAWRTGVSVVVLGFLGCACVSRVLFLR